MSTPARVPAGLPAGGQFAATIKAEAGVTLTASPRTVPHPAHRSPDHELLAAHGVGAGRLALLAPLEARTLTGQVPDDADRGAVTALVENYLHWRDLAETGPLNAYRAQRIADEASRQLAGSQVGFEHAITTGEDIHVAEEDLKASVRRADAAEEDLRWLADPQWRQAPAVCEPTSADGSRRRAAADRFADPGYRGQVF